MKLREIIDSSNQGKPVVYCDMDGVLADLFNYAAELHDVEHYSHMTDNQWDIFLQDSDAYHLFRDLPVFSSANDLLRLIKKYAGGYRILSSPLSYDKAGSIQGKQEWLKKHINILPDAEIYEHDKWIYAIQDDGTPNILIDDYGVNTRAWNAAGGIAIKYQADESPMSLVERRLKDIFKK